MVQYMKQEGNGEPVKICVFSDSHGRLGQMVEAMENEQPDLVFFLGDNYTDGKALAAAYPEVPMHLVRGNCDFCPGPDELFVEAGGAHFLLVHGHRQYAKSTTHWLAEAGKRKGADMVCFGHTHQGLNDWAENMWLFNPGTAGGIYNRMGYGVIQVENGRIRADLH